MLLVVGWLLKTTRSADYIDLSIQCGPDALDAITLSVILYEYLVQHILLVLYRHQD